MQVIIEHDHLLIVPDDEANRYADIVFMEQVLGLLKEGDACIAERINDLADSGFVRGKGFGAIVLRRKTENEGERSCQ